MNALPLIFLLIFGSTTTTSRCLANFLIALASDSPTYPPPAMTQLALWFCFIFLFFILSVCVSFLFLFIPLYLFYCVGLSLCGRICADIVVQTYMCGHIDIYIRHIYVFGHITYICVHIYMCIFVIVLLNN